MGEAQQPEPGPEAADHAEGEMAAAAPDGDSVEAASDGTDESTSAGEAPSDGETRIWDDLPPEVEYPLRPDEEAAAAAPGRAEAWRRRTAAGAIFTGFALGLREVLEPDRNEPSIVLETSGVPPKDLPVEADIDQVPPRQSVVRIRPWLLPPAPAKTAEKRVVADKER